MKLKILAFGIAKDIVGDSEIEISVADENANVLSFKKELLAQFPDFEKLYSLRVAVNAEYVDDSFELSQNDEIVLIPPVSGG